MESDLFDCVESDILNFKNKGNILLCGDLNARVGSMCDFIIDDDNRYIPTFDSYQVDKQILLRKSQDTKIDSRGKSLIDLCISHQLRLLNGRIIGDLFGKYTCYKPVGASVVDYAIMSEGALNQVLYFRVNDFIPTLSDCHSKIEWKMSALYTTAENNNNEEVFPMLCNYKWSDDSSEKFQAALSSVDIQNMIHDFETCNIENSLSSINNASKQLTDILVETADKSLRRPTKRKTKRAGQLNNNWFDNDLRKLRNNLTNYSKVYSRYPNDSYVRNHFYKLNRLYTKTRKAKKREFKKSILQEIECLHENNPKLYWKLINDLQNDSAAKSENNISPTQWLNHFQDLNSLKSEFTDRLNELNEKLNDAEKSKCFNELDFPITDLEIAAATMKLKNNKAPGLDSITNNMLKSGQSFLKKCLLKIFNSCLTFGLYPELWAEGYIKPLHKSGDIDNPNNYRGLTITSCVGKLFNCILNTRLEKFLVKHNLIDNSQIGFTKKARTSDHMFIIKCIVDKYCSNKDGRVFACFVDLRKAFDTVIHTGLKLKLLDLGVGNKFYNVIKHMYTVSKSCIKNNNTTHTRFFESKLGVKQGDNLSPNLFKIFINDLPKCLEQTADPILLNSRQVHCLMYADDIVLLSSSASGLQEKITSLEEFCQDWCLTVNLTKTKVLIFNKAGRHLKHNFMYTDKLIECVNKCKYLGITFCSSGSFSTAQNELYQKGLKAYFKLCKDFLSHNPSPKISLHVFDHTILPIITYACEIWGYFNPMTNRIKRKPDIQLDDIYKGLPCETLHVKFCKFVLGCGKKSTNFAVLSELGRLPIHYNIINAMLRFWHRLQNLDDQFPILQDAFLTSIQLHSDGLPSWYASVDKIKKDVFNNSIAGLPSLSTTLFKKSCNKFTRIYYINQWEKQKELYANGKLCTYLQFKNNFGFENYLTILKDFGQRRMLTRFRISAHRLRIELGRYQGTLRRDRLCLHCSSNDIEDEVHFLFNCDKFENERNSLINFIKSECSLFSNLQDTQKLIWLMNNEDKEILVKICFFISNHGPSA